jgi:hypothetical protein
MYALQPFDDNEARSRAARDRRVHLADLSGLLSVVVLVFFGYTMRALRRRELSLASFAHVLSMAVVFVVGGHFIEVCELNASVLAALTLCYNTGARVRNRTIGGDASLRISRLG